MVFDATLGPPATILPRRVDQDGTYNVILAGSMTNAQNEQVRKQHSVRGSTVRGLLRCFKANNHLFKNVAVDEGSIDAMAGVDSLLDAILVVDDDERLAFILSKTMWRLLFPLQVSGRTWNAKLSKETCC